MYINKKKFILTTNNINVFNINVFNINIFIYYCSKLWDQEDNTYYIFI